MGVSLVLHTPTKQDRDRARRCAVSFNISLTSFGCIKDTIRLDEWAPCRPSRNAIRPASRKRSAQHADAGRGHLHSSAQGPARGCATRASSVRTKRESAANTDTEGDQGESALSANAHSTYSGLLIPYHLRPPPNLCASNRPDPASVNLPSHSTVGSLATFRDTPPSPRTRAPSVLEPTSPSPHDRRVISPFPVLIPSHTLCQNHTRTFLLRLHLRLLRNH